MSLAEDRRAVDAGLGDLERRGERDGDALASALGLMSSSPSRVPIAPPSTGARGARVPRVPIAPPSLGAIVPISPRSRSRSGDSDVSESAYMREDIVPAKGAPGPGHSYRHRDIHPIYNEFARLFGILNYNREGVTVEDVRPRKFLNVLHECAETLAKEFGDPQVKPEYVYFNASNENVVTQAFTTECTKYVNDDYECPTRVDGSVTSNMIHPEWIIFISDLKTMIEAKIKSSDQKPDRVILGLIRKAGHFKFNPRTHPRVSALQVVIIKVILSMFKVSDSGDRALVKPEDWTRASKYIYNESWMNMLFPPEYIMRYHILRKSIKPEELPTLTSVSRYYQFNINPTAFQLRRWIEDSYDEYRGSVSSLDDMFGDHDGSCEYTRNARGRLIKHGRNGREIVVENDSHEFNRLVTPENKCYTTGFKGDTAQCANFFEKYLNGNMRDINNCKEFLTNGNFWNIAQREVNSMLPDVAVRTLQALTFIKIRVNGLYEFESVSDWLKKIRNSMNYDDYKQIRNNSQLIGYLQMLIRKVNDCPIILNKDYDSKKSTCNSTLKNTRFTKMGVREYVPLSNNLTINMSDLARLSTAITTVNRSNQLLVSMHRNPALGLVIPAHVGYTGIMTGGSYDNQNTLEALKLRLDPNKTVSTHSYFGRIAETYFRQLEARGQSLHDGDRKKVMAAIEDLGRSERKLTKIMIATNKYLDLIDTHGVQTSKSGVLTLEHLKNFVDVRERSLNKTVKKQTSLLNVFTSLAEAVSNLNIQVRHH